MEDNRLESRFWVEAQVGTAKSMVFLSAAERSVRRTEFAAGAIEAYYSLFHFSLAMIWLMPKTIPPRLLKVLIGERDAGRELPSRLISHRAVTDYLRDRQFPAPLSNLRAIHKQVLALREFASYGPRVTYRGSEPVVGPCHFRKSDVAGLVAKLPAAYSKAFLAAKRVTAYRGGLATIVLGGARALLCDSQFQFVGWVASPTLILARRHLAALARRLK